jgi:hypothetical protein
MIRRRAPIIALLGLGSAGVAVAVFLLTRAHFGGTVIPVMAGGFVALILPILAVMLLWPLLAEDRKE